MTAATETPVSPAAPLARAHALAVAEVARLTGTDPNRGLSYGEARKRLATVGPNEFKVSRAPGALGVLVQQFTGLVVYVLAAATLVSLLAGEWIDAIAITGILILNGVLGFVQEYRAERSLAALERMTSPAARVVRDGDAWTVPTRDVVPGDVLLIEAGDIVAADARVVSERHLQCHEAALTGESTPVMKQVDPVSDEAEVGDRASMVFAATTVTAGSGRAIVVATGLNTEAGRLAALSRQGRETTPLQRRLEATVRLLVVGAIALAAALFVAGIARGESPEDMFLTTVALAVAAIPEGLPAAVTVVLAIGVQRMVRRNVIVRRLESVETLGSTTVICTDKTGTLTQNRMDVREIFIDGKRRRIDELLSARAARSDGVQAADALAWSAFVSAACNTAAIGDGPDHAFGDPTEVALLSFARDAGVDPALRARIGVLDELPFDSERQRMTTILEREPGRYVAAMKGAPEVVFGLSDRVLRDGHEVTLDAEVRRQLEQAAADMASDGLRVLALAYRPLDSNTVATDSEAHMIVLSIIGLADPLRPEALPSIQACRAAGIRPMILTGDHAGTARAIGRELGFDGASRIVLGRELASMSDDELAQTVQTTDIYARISGEHKLRIIRGLHRHGEIVAMTGDGVNDAPALNAADIGVAMGRSGTDVAREASDVVLTDDNFRSIVAAVEEGRRIYANIRRLTLFLLSCNLGEVLFVAAASLAVGEPALLPVQILWVNLVTDSLPALSLGVEPARTDQMRRPPRDPKSGILSVRIAPMVSFQAVLIATAAGIAFAIGMRDDVDAARELAFMTLVVAHVLAVLNFRSLRRPVGEIGILTNPVLTAAFVVAIVVQLIPFYLPALNDPFNVTPLLVREWGLVMALALIAFVPVELTKFARAVAERRG